MPLSSRADSSEPPIKGTSDQIADRIRAEIESGTLSPGASLNQVGLAARFGLSRIPVREALRRLEAEGYVTYRPNKGATVVANLAPADVAEILEIRECIEARLMQHVLHNVTPQLMADAAAALGRMERAQATAQSMRDLRGLHEHYHTIFFDAGARPRMTAIINDWRFRFDSAPEPELKRQRDFYRRTKGVHQRLLAAVRRRDVKAVRRAIAEEYAVIRKVAIGPT